MKSVRWHHHYYYEISSTATDQVLPDSREHLSSSSKRDPHSPLRHIHVHLCAQTRAHAAPVEYLFHLERNPSYLWSDGS